MLFSEVSYADLSDITHKIFISDHAQFITPELKIIKFFGHYRYGSAGSNDAHYIYAACKAAHTAWHTDANIIDFTELAYQWGDEMEGIFSFGWDRHTKSQHPLAVIVGDSCREALRSLLGSQYQEDCRDTIDEAITLVKQKRVQQEEYLVEWRKSVGV